MRLPLPDVLARVAVRVLDTAHAAALDVLDRLSVPAGSASAARDEADDARAADLRAEIAARGAARLVEADGLYGRLRAHLATLARGRAPLTVHERVRALQALGLPPPAVLVVLGGAPEVDAYFEARADGRHDVGADGRCRICGARQRDFPPRCVPS